MFERNLETLNKIGAIFDFRGLLRHVIEVYNLAEVTRLENSLEKRLESLENTIQMRSEMTSSLIGLNTEKRFGIISIVLGIFVVFEVLGTYMSWAFASPSSEVYFLWSLVIVSPVLLVTWLVYRSPIIGIKIRKANS